MTRALRLADGSSWPRPLADENLIEKLNCYHSEIVTLTRSEAWALREIVGAYGHLCAHPAGVEATVIKVRMIRRALRVRA